MKYVNENFLYVDVKTKLKKDCSKGPLQIGGSMVWLAIFLGEENILWIDSWHNVKVSNAQIFRQFSFAEFEYLRHVPHKNAKFWAFPTLLLHDLSQLQRCPPKLGHQGMDRVKNYHTNQSCCDKCKHPPYWNPLKQLHNTTHFENVEILHYGHCLHQPLLKSKRKWEHNGRKMCLTFIAIFYSCLCHIFGHICVMLLLYLESLDACMKGSWVFVPNDDIY